MFRIFSQAEASMRRQSIPAPRKLLGKPVSDDIKWNVIHFYEESESRVQAGQRKYSETEIGRKACPAQPLHRDTVSKILKSWKKDRCLNSNGKCGGVRANNTTLDIWAQEFLLDTWLTCSTLTLEEYRIKLAADIGVHVHESNICRFFKKVKLPLKLVQRKCGRAYTAENVIYHRDFIMFVATMDSTRLRYYDETSVTGRPYGRTRGRAPPGQGIIAVEQLPDNFRWSLCGLTCTKPGWQPIEVMAWDGVQTGLDVVHSFQHWCATGVFEFGDIVIMDRAGTHSIEVTDILTELLAVYGVILIFSPKYSPECNPIELAWNKLKYILRYKYYRTNKWDSFGSLLLACREIKMDDMRGFYRHCGSGY